VQSSKYSNEKPKNSKSSIICQMPVSYEA
jgi:hypothetical protein